MPIASPFTLTNTDGESCAFDIMNLESLNQQWGIDDSRVTVQYRIPWAKRFVARKLLLGTVTAKTAGAAWYLSRTVPHSWVESESLTAGDNSVPLYATRITGTVGYGTQPAPTVYNDAIITVVYEDLPYDIKTDGEITATVSGVVIPDEALFKRFVEPAERTTEGRIIHSFGLGAIFADNNKPVMNGAPFPYYEETIPYIWHSVPRKNAPITVASGMLNKMNSVTFAGFPPRTLLMAGAPQIYTRSPDQQRTVNIKYTFKYNRFRWDYLPDPTRSFQWFRVVMKADNTKTLFEEDDFKKLFRPVAPS